MGEVEAAIHSDVDNALCRRDQDPWGCLQRLSNVLTSYADGIFMKLVLKEQYLRLGMQLRNLCSLAWILYGQCEILCRIKHYCNQLSGCSLDYRTIVL